MILESLLELVKTLKERIDKHDDQLRKSEWLTRYALVDPLLRELGWDTEDPKSVIPEYQSKYGRADYALIGDGKPVMMVEAKKLGTQLRDSVLSQGIQYCLEEGTKHFSVTDGQSWEVYETHKPVPIEQKRVVEFDLRDPSSAAVCLKALVLWRHTVQAGQTVPGEESIFEPSEEPSVPPPTTSVKVNIPTPTPQVEELEWIPLDELTAVTGQKPPVELRLPNDMCVPIQYWNGLMVESTRWLFENGHLTPDLLPVQHPGSDSRYLVSKTAVHPGGKAMSSGVEVSGVWVERHYSGPYCVENAIVIIQHANQNPAQFSVRFS